MLGRTLLLRRMIHCPRAILREPAPAGSSVKSSSPRPAGPLVFRVSALSSESVSMSAQDDYRKLELTEHHVGYVVRHAASRHVADNRRLPSKFGLRVVEVSFGFL